MKKNLGKKARIHFSDMEKEYQKKYGIMPDYHIDRLREELHDSDRAFATVQANMDAVWLEMRERHNPAFRDCHDSPFSLITGQGGAE